MNLYQSRDNCCGCGACYSACPMNAITMMMDQLGHWYPAIDESKCIDCGQCCNVCQFHNRDEYNESLKVYAVCEKDKQRHINSASAGVFAELALSCLQGGGVVYGATLEPINGILTAHHIRVENESDLPKILGSKYVQSAIEECYRLCKADLENNIHVIFSGTPCQISGLRKYLGREYDQLLLVDIACHGVPSIQLFRNYINATQKEVVSYKFRDRMVDEGGHSVSYIYLMNGKRKKYREHGQADCYYGLFLMGAMYQESCYQCAYAKDAFNRPSDITVCDYWGFKKVHTNYSFEFKNSNLISGTIINTKKGENAFNRIKSQFFILQSDAKKISANNDIFNKPTPIPPFQSDIIKLYQEDGFEALEEWYRNRIGKKYYLYKLFFRLPKIVKKTIRRLVF